VPVHPTFASQWGPLLAAGLALVGVLVTLLVTGRREAIRSFQQRQDEYVREERLAVAKLMAAAQSYMRDLGLLCDLDRLRHEPMADRLVVVNRVDESMRDFARQAGAARLVVHDVSLSASLDTVQAAWASAVNSAYELSMALTSAAPVAVDGSTLRGAREALVTAMGDLEAVAIERLMPSAAREVNS
jgi:hypothetical protein